MTNASIKTKSKALLISYLVRAAFTLLLYGIIRIAKVEQTSWFGLFGNAAAVANIPALLALVFNVLFSARYKVINDKAFPFVSAVFDWGICSFVGAIALCLDYFRAAQESGVGNGLMLLVLPALPFMLLVPFALLLIVIMIVTLQQLKIVE